MAYRPIPPHFKPCGKGRGKRGREGREGREGRGHDVPDPPPPLLFSDNSHTEIRYSVSLY